MRVSAQAFFKESVSTLQRLQSELNNIQQQIATGRRIQSPSDDPVGASRALDIRESVGQLDQYERNSELAVSRLRLQEQSLTTTTGFLQRARELTLQAGNATQTNETRGFIAAELRGLLDATLAAANAQDSNGQYLFGGFQTSTPPYSRDANGFNYNGDQGRREVQIGPSRRLTDSEPGDRVFGRLREGNGQIVARPATTNTGEGVINVTTLGSLSGYNYERYDIVFTTPTDYEVRDDGGAVLSTGVFESGDDIAIGDFQFNIAGSPATGDSFSVDPSRQTDVFTLLDGLASALEAGTPSSRTSVELQTEIDAGILGLDQALTSVLNVRSETGIRLGVAETELDNNGATRLVLQESLADIEDIDYAAAISALTQQATALEAAQQSFVRVQGLSLFNYL
ncbi:MAG: flagellar hook-associated protein FlgL [Woeseiaceae bacterium]